MQMVPLLQTIPGHVITEEMVQKTEMMKSKKYVANALPNEHQLTFNQYKDAKTLFEALQIVLVAMISLNEVNTSNVQLGTANSVVSTDSTLDSTANLKTTHEDDLEEMDLKWQLALLSMRARRYYQRTGKKITINGSDTAGYDKSKVECFNCHKMGHFARECRDEEVPTNLALMASQYSRKEFQQPEFEGYGFKANKSVYENSSNEIKKTTDAPIIEDWVSDCDEDERNFVPTAVLTKSGIVPVNVARPINTAAPKSFVNAAKTRPNAFQKNLNDKVNTAKINSVNTAKGNRVTSAVREQGINAVKSTACWA
ncbi:putative ribonuclease H-like domain-containing protein [Tanacetum coccineum]